MDLQKINQSQVGKSISPQIKTNSSLFYKIRKLTILLFIIFGILFIFGEILSNTKTISTPTISPTKKVFSNKLDNKDIPTITITPIPNIFNNYLLNKQLDNLPLAIIDNPFFLINNYTLYYFPKLNSQPIKIDTQCSGSIQLSTDHKILAYLKYSLSNKIYFYEIETKNKRNLETTETRLRKVSWSPDGKYLITSSGSDVYGQTSIYRYEDGKKMIDDFKEESDKIFWLNNDEFVFQDLNFELKTRPWGGGGARGISKISLSNMQKKELITPTNQYDYYLIGSENKMIIYQKINIDDYTNPVNETEGNKGIYFKMDNNGQNNSQIQQNSINMLNEKAILKNNLPQQFSEYEISNIWHNSLDINWIMVELQNKVKSDNKIIILNLSSLKENLKIAFEYNKNGISIIW